MIFSGYTEYGIIGYGVYNSRFINCNFFGVASRHVTSGWPDNGYYEVGIAMWGGDGTTNYDSSFCNMNLIQNCNFKNLYQAGEFISVLEPILIQLGTVQGCNIGFTALGYLEDDGVWKGDTNCDIHMEKVWMEQVWIFRSSYGVDKADGSKIELTGYELAGEFSGRTQMFYGSTPQNSYNAVVQAVDKYPVSVNTASN